MAIGNPGLVKHHVLLNMGLRYRLPCHHLSLCSSDLILTATLLLVRYRQLVYFYALCTYK